MGAGMNLEQAREYAKAMTYSEAVQNIKTGKGIKYRKATMIKLRELAEIADRLDRVRENSVDRDELGDCNICRFAGCSECDDCINGSRWVRETKEDYE